jgi:hypothetical protein
VRHPLVAAPGGAAASLFHRPLPDGNGRPSRDEASPRAAPEAGIEPALAGSESAVLPIERLRYLDRLLTRAVPDDPRGLEPPYRRLRGGCSAD